MNDSITVDSLQQELLAQWPEVGAEWRRTRLARAAAACLASYRHRHGLSQRDLAHRLGLRPGAVAAMEEGDRNPSWQTLARIAEQLGLSLHLVMRPDGEFEMVAVPADGQQRKADAA